MKNNPVALITGASRGIGAATAIHFARNGYDICINYNVDHQSAKQVAQQASNYGVCVEIIQANVSQDSEVVAMFKKLYSIFGKLDVLVNNAGILKPQMPLLKILS
jgi:NAD(P)-dependent dehydrogenase (short-subunit alcohol dehydrogenase family)